MNSLWLSTGVGGADFAELEYLISGRQVLD
jgi:hypothetical protein